MNVEVGEADLRLSKGVIHLGKEGMMEGRGRGGAGKKSDYHLHLHHHHHHHQGNKRLLRTSKSYFSLESLLVLICLTASLVILPLILPPLPPPPLMLLLLPIGILAVLMILAFMPSNLRDLTSYTYV